MLESLYIGATGMHTQQTNLDVIANNLANVNTSGYKKNRVNFEDLMYRSLAATNQVTDPNGSAQFIGVGSAIATTNKVFSQGEVKSTGNELDVAVQGNGFFELQAPDGSYVYTRNGAFQTDSNGVLVNAAGYAVMPMIQVPSDATDIAIEADGSVLATVAGETQPIVIGQIELANFVNNSALEPQGNGLYVPNRDTGQPFYGRPKENGFGGVAQGFLEGSNVELIDELLALIVAQRAYEINSRVVQASDEMLSLANSMRR